MKTEDDFRRHHFDVERFEEHDRQWLSCKYCGATAVIVETSDGEEIEPIDDGDEACQRRHNSHAYCQNEGHYWGGCGDSECPYCQGSTECHSGW